jgi:transcriptional regulator with XRE-family HTH domain
MAGGLMAITRIQIRLGRVALGWSQQDLADRAVVAVNAVARRERGKTDIRTSTLEKIEKALIKGGIIFIPASDGLGEGVRLRKPSKS